ncbi:MAG TPA: phosphotransferase [Chloroflexota bacterium]|nr:phosphotransferase [Chloroflexota bacterium]
MPELESSSAYTGAAAGRLPPHTVSGSVDALLSPTTLSRLTGHPVTNVRRLPFSSVDGRSGGSLETVEAEGAGRYVLKRFSWERDVTMRMSRDRAGRAVTMWERGLLDRLPPLLTHGVVGCAREGDGWAMLLEDFEGHMLPPDEERLSDDENGIVLGALAALHSAFWDEPLAAFERYDLCSFRTRYEAFFPGRTLDREDGRLPIVPYIREGWQLLPELVEPDVADLVQRLHADVTPLCTALARYPRTLLHGDCHHGNIGIIARPDPRVILLDWAFVSLGPPAADLGEYVSIGVMRLPSSKEATIELYRRLLALRLGERFDDSWWLPQLELAFLGEFLRLGWNKTYVAAHGESEEIRQRERREIAWWCDLARRATRWL